MERGRSVLSDDGGRPGVPAPGPGLSSTTAPSPRHARHPPRRRPDRALRSIQDYFETERDETLGVIAAGALLDFVLAEIGPSVYNRAVRDAQEHLHARLAELDIDVHEPEFPYWGR